MKSTPRQLLRSTGFRHGKPSKPAFTYWKLNSLRTKLGKSRVDLSTRLLLSKGLLGAQPNVLKGSSQGHGAPLDVQSELSAGGMAKIVAQIRGVFLNYDPIHTKK